MTEAASRLAGCEATMQHITLLRGKRARLRAALNEAEAQYLHGLACAYAAGQLGMDDLADLYEHYRAGAESGYAAIWNEILPVRAQELVAHRRKQPYRASNAAGGGWCGAYPFDNGPTPGTGTCVVYVLYDSQNEPCYVGSTRHFRMRLNRHARDGKDFARWHAHPCADRKAAYAMETRLLREHKPYLNKRAAA